MSNTRWQKALLPFMQLTIVLLTVFYLVASYVQFSFFAARVEKQSSADIAQFVSGVTAQSLAQNSLSPEEKQWLAQCFFEAYTVESRQRNAEFLMISRTWIKYLGFITGVILAVVGAIFILGKLKDDTPSVLDGGTAQLKFSLTSHSPGIVLAVLGTVLIVSTIFTHQNIEKTDASVYLDQRAYSTTNSLSPEMTQKLIRLLEDSTLNQKPDTARKRPAGF